MGWWGGVVIVSRGPISPLGEMGGGFGGEAPNNLFLLTFFKKSSLKRKTETHVWAKPTSQSKHTHTIKSKLRTSKVVGTSEGRLEV